MLPQSVHILILALSAFCLFHSSEAVAQIFSEDIRLSQEVSQTVFPNDVKIQSTSRIGNISLVVWGSARRAGEDSVSNALYWQLLRDTTKLGIPEELTGLEHQPFGFVQVIALEDRFLVLWHDRAGQDSNLLSRMITLDGKVNEVDVLYKGIGSVHTVSLSGKMRMYIQVPEGEIRREVNGQGVEIFSELDSTDNPVVDIYWSTRKDSIGVLLRMTGPPEFFDVDGNSIALPKEVMDRFNYPYYLDSLLHLYVVQWPKVFIYDYLTDVDTVRTFEVRYPSPAWDSTTQYYRFVPGSVFITVDVSNNIWVTFGRVQYSIRRLDPEILHFITFEEYAVRETGLANRVYTRDVGYFNSWLEPGIELSRIEIGVAAVERFCNQSARKRYHVEAWTSGITHSHGRRFTADIGLGWGRDGRFYHRVSDAENQCRADSKGVHRIVDTDSSIVAMVIDDSTSIRLAVPLPRFLKNLSESQASIALQSDKLFVSWFQVGNHLLAEAWEWEEHKLEKTDVLFLDGSTQLKTHSTGTSCVVSKRVNADSLGLYALQNGNWLPLSDGGNGKALSSVTIDPQDREVVVSVIRSAKSRPDWVSATLYSESWNQLNYWDSLQFFGTFATVISLNDSVLIGKPSKSQSLYRFHGTSLKDSAVNVVGLHSVVPYYNHTFLSWSYNLSDNTLQILRFNADGKIVGQGKVSDDFASIEPSLTQVILNPNDPGSGVVFLYLNNGVLKAAALDRDLNYRETSIVNNTGMNINFADGVFRNDTLYVVWVDGRNEVADVYGNAVVPNISLSVENQHRSVEPVSLISLVSPNPTGSTLKIQLKNGLVEETEVEIWDMKGVKHTSVKVDRGENEVMLSTDALPAGAYLVKAGHGKLQDSHVLFIVR